MKEDQLREIEKRTNSALATESQMRSDINALIADLRWEMNRRLVYLTEEQYRRAIDGCHHEQGGVGIGVGFGLF